MTNIDFNQFAQGALAEKANKELQRAFENIADPNTDHKKSRKVTITIELKPTEGRDVIITSVTAKSTLAPAKSVETQILLGYQGNRIIGKELHSGIPGQSFFDDAGTVKTDTGEPVEETETTATDNKVVKFK